MVLVHTERYFQRHLDEIRAELRIMICWKSVRHWIEIMPKNVNKASALEHIAEENGFTLDEVIAFGDAENDIEMLRRCGYGIAMGNAMEQVKAGGFCRNGYQ